MWWREARASQRPPPPTPPHKGEGSTPSTPHDYASSTIENSQHRVLPISPFSHGLSRSPLRTAVLVPAARFCARGLKLWLRYPEFKGWRSAERRTDACEASVGPARNAAGQALRRRLASHNAGRPPLGALTVAIFGSGAALPSPAFAPDQSQRAPRARVVVPGSRLSVTSRDDGSRAVATGRPQIVSKSVTLFVAGPSRNGCERCHCRPRRNSVWTAFRLDRTGYLAARELDLLPPPLAGEGWGEGG